MANLHQFPVREKDSLVALLIVDDSPESVAARNMLASNGVPFLEQRTSDDYDAFAGPVMPYLKVQNQLYVGMTGIERYLTEVAKKTAP